MGILELFFSQHAKILECFVAVVFKYMIFVGVSESSFFGLVILKSSSKKDIFLLISKITQSRVCEKNLLCLFKAAF